MPTTQTDRPALPYSKVVRMARSLHVCSSDFPLGAQQWMETDEYVVKIEVHAVDLVDNTVTVIEMAGDAPTPRIHTLDARALAKAIEAS